jgi:hypothetical protein
MGWLVEDKLVSGQVNQMPMHVHESISHLSQRN